jgi:putative two-component system response regulator
VSGSDALAIALDQDNDLILLNVAMSEMDGYEACTRLKQDLRTLSILVNFITALIQEGSGTKGLSVDAIDYVTKPIQPPIDGLCCPLWGRGICWHPPRN